jgi:hypothetical protein
VPIATVDWSDPTTNNEQVQVSARELNNGCPDGQIEVRGVIPAGTLASVGFTIAFM